MPPTSDQHSALQGLHSENVGVRGQTTVSRHMPISDCFCLFPRAHFLSLPLYMLSSLPFLGTLAFTFLWQQTQSVCRLAWCRLLPPFAMAAGKHKLTSLSHAAVRNSSQTERITFLSKHTHTKYTTAYTHIQKCTTAHTHTQCTTTHTQITRPHDLVD